MANEEKTQQQKREKEHGTEKSLREFRFSPDETRENRN